MKYSYSNLPPLIMLILLFSASAVKELAAQQLVKEKSFIVQTPFLEPDGRKLSLLVKDSLLVNLGKSKGGSRGQSEYLLELRDRNLALQWQVSMHPSPKENFMSLFAAGKTLFIFSVIHDLKGNKAKLKAYHFSMGNGALKQEKILVENKVDPWQDAYGKGGVRMTMQHYIMSGSSHMNLTPLQYQYRLSISPDSSKILAYFYDYSKTTMLAHIAIFDAELKLLQQGQVPVDGGYVNQGVYINNRGELFLLNAGRDGDIAVVRYDFSSKRSRFLQIKSSSGNRADYQFNFYDDDRVLVRTLAERDGKLTGIMFSSFNFAENQVEEIHYFDIATILSSTSDSTTAGSNLGNFAQAAFFIHKNKEIVLVLEERNYISPGFIYERHSRLSPSVWHQRKARIEAGNLFVICLTEEMELKWAHFMPKSQTAIANEGFNTIGVTAALLEDRADILYQGGHSQEKLQYLSLNLDDGHIIKNVKMENSESLVLLRPYTHWIGNNFLILVGKKGFSGKSSSIRKYSLNLN